MSEKQKASLVVPMVLNGVSVEGIIDTAAQVTIINENLLSGMQGPLHFGKTWNIKGILPDKVIAAKEVNGVQFSIGSQMYHLIGMF